jgi:hypothetical protein
MALYRWPTDPPGKPAAHTIPYQQHLDTLAAKPGSQVAPYSQVSVSLGGGQSAPISQYGTGPGKIAPYSQIPVSIGGGKTIPADQYQAWLAKQGAGGAGAGAAAGSSDATAATGAAPPDPIYLARLNSLGLQRDQDYADIGGARTQGLLDYGFNEDPAGGLAFNPNDPFSKASLLKRTYDTSRRTTAQSMGSTGGLYSGAFQSGQDVVNRNQLQDEDALQKSLQSFLAQNTSARARAGTAYQIGAGEALGESLGRIDTNPLYEPTATAPVAAAPAAAVQAARGTGLPQKTVNGRRFYQRASDKKWIPF